VLAHGVGVAAVLKKLHTVTSLGCLPEGVTAMLLVEAVQTGGSPLQPMHISHTDRGAPR
jgi:hypothetical protein